MLLTHLSRIPGSYLTQAESPRPSAARASSHVLLAIFESNSVIQQKSDAGAIALTGQIHQLLGWFKLASRPSSNICRRGEPAQSRGRKRRAKEKRIKGHILFQVTEIHDESLSKYFFITRFERTKRNERERLHARAVRERLNQGHMYVHRMYIASLGALRSVRCSGKILPFSSHAFLPAAAAAVVCWLGPTTEGADSGWRGSSSESHTARARGAVETKNSPKISSITPRWRVRGLGGGTKSAKIKKN